MIDLRSGRTHLDGNPVVVGMWVRSRMHRSGCKGETLCLTTGKKGIHGDPAVYAGRRYRRGTHIPDRTLASSIRAWRNVRGGLNTTGQSPFRHPVGASQSRTSVIRSERQHRWRPAFKLLGQTLTLALIFKDCECRQENSPWREPKLGPHRLQSVIL